MPSNPGDGVPPIDQFRDLETAFISNSLGTITSHVNGLQWVPDE